MNGSSTLPSLYVIGAGNVGVGLCLALRQRGHAAAAILSRSPETAARLRAEHGLPAEHGEPGPACATADVVLLCVPDQAIQACAQWLREQRHGPRPGAVLAHTSGCCEASALGPWSHNPCASLHPLVACPSPQRAAAGLVDAFWALEGDDAAQAPLRALAETLGGTLRRIHAGAKPQYHAAAVLASNLVAALLSHAMEQAEAACGDSLQQALAALAMGAVEQVGQLGPARGLTGPIVRGDVATVESHLRALHGPALESYRCLSRRALELAVSRGLSPSTVAQLGRLLGET